MSLTRLVRITSITFKNFKAFRQYSINFDQVNILVGANNSGKSTIISALRALDAALKIARSQPPKRLHFDDETHFGYRIPENSISIALENVRTDYNIEKSVITFNISNRNVIDLIFPVDGGCVLVPDARGTYIDSSATFKRLFPIFLTVVPVLGPVENNEIRREKSTIVTSLSTHRASRHFRNYWYYFPDGFEEFSRLVRSTWLGMDIERPELNASSAELTMFCREDRMTRELYWVGFGFQIWCQLLTHISRSKNTGLIVMDEPETYLHPDVQRQLLAIVRDIGADVLIATHSSEIMSESEPSEIVVIDKTKRSGERLKDVVGVQRALDAVGSSQNITLTALARSRRIVFVEGDDDFRVLRRFARRLGLSELASGVGLIALRSGGFGSWQRISTLASGIADALGASLSIAAVYDRDYFCEDQIFDIIEKLSEHVILAHVHDRKEIENYFLIPDVLDRALHRANEERSTRSSVDKSNIESVSVYLREITDSMHDDVLSQILSKRATYLRSTSIDLANINKETLLKFEEQWRNIETRLMIVPGKEVIRRLRASIQERFNLSLTDARIIDSMHRDQIPQDLCDLLMKLDAFRQRVAV